MIERNCLKSNKALELSEHETAIKMTYIIDLSVVND